MNAKNQPEIFNAKSLIGFDSGIIIVNKKKFTIEIKDMPDCSKACPAGVNVKAYVNLVANKRFEEAIDVIRQANPFPAICGRVCTRPCEDNCEQGQKKNSVQIRALKRYASDYELTRRSLVSEPCEKIYNEKVAIIGAGPAGLSAAVDLVRMGYSVSVFDAEKESGGMLRYAIPPYRLPKRILKREIDWIKGLGIEIITEKHINDPLTLFKKGFSAVLIAQGSSKSLPLGIKEENTNGVVDPLLFLNKINIDNPMNIKDNIVVIGGGSTAFDVARSAIRLGSKKVTIAYRRSIKEMPAEKEEIEDAKKEGVGIKTHLIPKKIIVKKGKTIGIEFLKTKLGKTDESGRRRPVPIKGSEFSINADLIIPAIGLKPDVGSVGNIKITNEKGIVEVGEDCSTKIKGIFAAGDVETGPKSVVDAIGRGHIAAKGINTYLRKGDNIKEEKIQKSIPIVTEFKKKSKPLYIPKRLEKKEMITSFKEVEKSFADFEAVEEAARCFKCGPCHFCSVCLPNCDHKQLIARIGDTKFLLKTPCDLSFEVNKKGKSSYKLQSKRKIKSIELSSITAAVNSDLCIGCGRCEEVCAYRAINNIFIKDKKITAEVNHDSCSSCSACVSVCPTGAITQGYMSDNEILLRLHDKKTLNPGVKALMSYWSTPTHAFELFDGVVEVMSARKPSPSFLIRALARSGMGLLIIGPNEKTGSHYLPWEEHPFDIVQKTKNLLKLVGISPERIQYTSVPNETDPSIILQKFSQSLDKRKLKNLKLPIPKITMNPLGETLTLLRIMEAASEIKPLDDYKKLKPVELKGVAFFEGCLPMIHAIGKSHKLFDLSNTRIAIYKLIEKAKINCGYIQGLSCPSKDLLNNKIDGAKNFVERIDAKNLKVLNKVNPEKLIIGTPEAFATLSKDKDFKNVSSFPKELLIKLQKLKGFSQIKKTVSIHSSCLIENDPFIEEIKKLLKLIPGISIIELKGKCGFKEFYSLDSKSKKYALNLFNEAVKKDVDTIICTSPYCESHLLLCNREGSWQSTDIEITDVYKLLLSSLGESDI